MIFGYTYHMRSLYINPITQNITLTILENGEKKEQIILPRWDDFTDFPDILIDILDTRSIDEIWCILWPWAFTRMRIVTLTLSTCILTRSTWVKWCHFFDLIPSVYQPILQANDTEYIIKNPTSTELRHIDTLEAGIYMWYAKENDFTDEKKFIEYREDWWYIESIFQKLEPLDILTPIYLKEPHITWSKKNTSPSSEKTNTSSSPSTVTG